MPIRGITDAARIARAGKIRMGVRVANASGQGDHPKSVDHFVCPPSVLEYLTPDKVRYCSGACGEAPGPIELPIMFPVDDPERIASQHYRAYKRAGLVCKGDGYTARGMLVPAAAGISIDNHPKSVDTWAADGTWREFKCLGEGYDGEPACPLFAATNGCRKIMILQFLILDVPGIDVWQLDTGSVNAMLNINSTLNVLATIRGGVAGVPMTLHAEPAEVNVNGKRTKITTIRLSYDVTPRSLLAIPRIAGGPEVAQLEAPDEDREDPSTIDAEARLVEDPTPAAKEIEQQRGRDTREVVDLLTEAWHSWKDEAAKQSLLNDMRAKWPSYMSAQGNIQAGRLTATDAKAVLAWLKHRVRGEADPDAQDQPPEVPGAATADTEAGTGTNGASLATIEAPAPGYGDGSRPTMTWERPTAATPHAVWCRDLEHAGPCSRLHWKDCADPNHTAGACPEPPATVGEGAAAT